MPCSAAIILMIPAFFVPHMPFYRDEVDETAADIIKGFERLLLGMLLEILGCRLKHGCFDWAEHSLLCARQFSIFSVGPGYQ